METKKLLNMEILEIILSGIPKGKEFNNLEKQLENILRKDTGKLSERFKSHKIYEDFPELHTSLLALEAGGALPGWYSGLDCQSQQVADFVYRKAQNLTERLEPETFDYLKGIGRRINLLNQKGKFNTEIEVKYLIRETGEDYASSVFWKMFPSIYSLKKSVIKKGCLVQQGYFNQENGIELTDKLFATKLDFIPSEFRMRHQNNHYSFTIKSEDSISRGEIEIEISSKVFNKYWPMTFGRQVIKKRLEMHFQDYIAEIDAYLCRDLIVAEIEVPSINIANVLSPLGKNITKDSKYKNKNLAKYMIM